ncbi:hypothetical protein BCS93_04210 [Vibrio breoganii]|uniref:Uncharacterized protein n=1 Tax=Vibrio breoganii TaxID=553239 RepID=A0AAP8MZC5_9VIBR|nr:hypothetical protein [Vibrio breoganii]PMP14000.1 hypothetical protein BCS93_04210 [Vibrio breoganii]
MDMMKIGKYEYGCEGGTPLNPNKTAVRKDKDGKIERQTAPSGVSCETPQDAKKIFDELYASAT